MSVNTYRVHKNVMIVVHIGDIKAIEHLYGLEYHHAQAIMAFYPYPQLHPRTRESAAKALGQAQQPRS